MGRMREEPKGAAAIVPNVFSSLSKAGSAPAAQQGAKKSVKSQVPEPTVFQLDPGTR
jgi:hypothetical protein